MIFDDVNAYPLSWPVTWKRTDSNRRSDSRFADHSLARARGLVLDEVRMLKGRNIIISTNVVLRIDGLPRSGQRAPADPGVAVYFVLNGKPKVLACDKWRLIEDNLWAIGKHIEALRGQDRWGVGTMEQAFMGYEALPAAASTWWETLGVERTASAEEIQAAYRQKVKIAHPDAGGNQNDFIRIQNAWEQAREEKGDEG
ncbi:MAG TPA: DnaJ domain-containing protein [Bellilinea sp.]|nr:DnaJ domain-containing protein [Bellilinea sp.]